MIRCDDLNETIEEKFDFRFKFYLRFQMSRWSIHVSLKEKEKEIEKTKISSYHCVPSADQWII